MEDREHFRTKKWLGVDIGGTKTAVCLGDSSGNITQKVRFPTQKNPEPALEQIVTEAKKLMSKEQTPPSGIGISVPSPVDQSKGKILTPPNLKGWRNFPIVAEMKRFLDFPVHLENDANGGALAQWFFGNKPHIFGNKPHKRILIYLTMSTGMGGGIVLDGHLLRGENDSAGEFGHLVLDRHGPRCACGQRGCFEALCGGRSILQRVQKQIEEGRFATTLSNSQEINMQSIAAAYRAGDPFAHEVWSTFVDHLAQGIGALIMCFNPTDVVLGTIAVLEAKSLFPLLQGKLPQYAWKAPRQACSIYPSTLGLLSGELGALAIALYGESRKKSF